MVGTTKSLNSRMFMKVSLLVFAIFGLSYHAFTQNSLLNESINLLFQNDRVFKDLAVESNHFSKNCKKNVLIKLNDEQAYDSLNSFIQISNCVFYLSPESIFFYDPKAFVAILSFTVQERTVELVIEKRWKIKSISVKYRVRFNFNNGDLRLVKCVQIVDYYKTYKKRVARDRYDMLDPKK
jgi:hypothetical protein